MQFRSDRSLVWVISHTSGFVFGVVLLVYSIYVWSGYHFSLGPNVHIYPGVPDPSSGARWLFVSGLILSGYFGFALCASTLPPPRSRADAQDKSRPNI
jgi:hypothetical protein